VEHSVTFDASLSIRQLIKARLPFLNFSDITHLEDCESEFSSHNAIFAPVDGTRAVPELDRILRLTPDKLHLQPLNPYGPSRSELVFVRSEKENVQWSARKITTARTCPNRKSDIITPL
jgi:hypothetical protein